MTPKSSAANRSRQGLVAVGAALALLSCASIAYQVLLMRLLSVVHGHHFAVMVISLALLGVGASGTFLCFTGKRLVSRFSVAFPVFALGFALSVPAGAWIGTRVGFDPEAFFWHPPQGLRLVVTYLILAIAFFCSAGATALSLATRKEHLGFLYCADLVGAGLGAAAAVGLLFLLPPHRCLFPLMLCGLAAASIAGVAMGKGRSRLLALLPALAGIVLVWFFPQAFLKPVPSEFRPLHKVLLLPKARVLAERFGPLGMVTVVASEAAPFRHAPGLSLTAPALPPDQLGLFLDGDLADAITRGPADGTTHAFLDYLPTALPYRLTANPKTLVLGAGGGFGVLEALHHQARSVDAVEPNGQFIDLVAERFRLFSGRLYDSARVHTHRSDPRAFLEKSPGGYDLVQIRFQDPQQGTVRTLGENFLFTVEAFRSLYASLNPDGVLAITTWLSLPPRGALKLLATAALSLEREGVDPGKHLALLRSLTTVTLLVKKSPLTSQDVRAIKDFCAERLYDLSYFPGIRAEETNRFNVLDSPVFHEAALAVLGPQRGRFLADYTFHVAPATDDRPYFSDFLKWRYLVELLSMRGRGAMPLVEWGQVLVVFVLAQAVVAGAVLILLPLALGPSETARRGRGWRPVLYFLSLGLAFLFLEVVFIKRFTLFFGHPVWSTPLVLGTFLLFAGLGAGLSQRCAAGGMAKTQKALAGSIAALLLWVLLWVVLGPPATSRLLSAPTCLKLAVALGTMAPLAFLMGMPFPLGLGLVSHGSKEWIPWAWSINGCASVAAPLLALLLSVQFGFAMVTASAACLYALAYLTMRAPRPGG